MSESFTALLPFWFELRKRLLSCFGFFTFIALVLMFFSRPLFNFFAHPILKILPAHHALIAIGVVSGFWVPLELSLWLALLLTIPLLLWQLWRFVAPALKRAEKYWGRFYLICSMLLMLGGLLFGYLMVLPVCLHFLLLSAPISVTVMPDIVNYLNFCWRLLVVLALTSQLPLLMLLLVQLQWLSLAQMQMVRRYFIVVAFVVGMIVAPDVISQCFIAVPLWLLYEFGLLLVHFLQKYF